jgi:DNA-binding IclR family transcriptional regulator
MMQHSVGRAFAVLEVLAGAAQPMRLIDLADELRLGHAQRAPDIWGC